MTGFNLSLRSQKGRNAAAVPGVHFKRPGSKERLVGANGEINASSRTDLIVQLAALIDSNNQGMIDEGAGEVTASAKERNEVLSAAFADKSGSRWSEIGAGMAGTLSEAADRDGFMRKILIKEEVAQGNVPRIRVRRKRVTAIISAGNGSIYPTIARDDYYYPPEFTISANVRVEKRELNQGSGDILADKYQEAAEQVLKTEDLRLKELLDATVGIANPLVALVGGLTVSTFTHMRQQISAYNLPVSKCLFSSSYWNDLISSSSFGSYYDPVTKYELLQTGYLGNILGVDLISDAYRHPNLRVLGQSDFYMLGDGANLGAYCDRGPIESVEVSEATLGSNSRGFFLSEDLAMLLFNARAVVRAVRA